MSVNMNSTLKPVLPQSGVAQPGGQSSPAKANVAGVNNAVSHPQGAQNSVHHPTNNLVVQNLVHHPPNPQLPPHAVPSMAPVSANMAQMAHNMSHHGNLSHNNQNAAAAAAAHPNPTTSPSKPSTSSPLSLVQDKPPSQPLALTRTPEKKDEAAGQSNGTVDSPKAPTNASVTPVKPQAAEPKDKVETAAPSLPKSIEKPAAPSTPEKPEKANIPAPADPIAQPKPVAASKPPEKSPAKPVEPKPAPTADVAPVENNAKPIPETANIQQEKPKDTKEKTEEKPKPAEAIPKKPADTPKPEEAAKPVDKKESDTVDGKIIQEPPKETIKVEEKKVETPKPKAEPKPAKSTMKLATVTPPVRKRKQASPSKPDGASAAKKPAEESTPRTKRCRTQVQLYQSPTPELAMATKLSASEGRATPPKQNDDKLIVFYKNEYLAVRNAEGGFFICQAMQNVYRNTRKIKIRWLSQDKTADPSGETYKPDFYDVTDMETVLTTLSLIRAPSGGGSQILKPSEEARAKSILDRALNAEKSGVKPNIELTEEHPDGLDLSLYKDESQLEKKSRKRKAPPASDADESVVKTPKSTPKRSPRSAKKAKGKQSPAGSTPKGTAKTAVPDKVTPKATKSTPQKNAKSKTPAKAASAPETPKNSRRSLKSEPKPSPVPVASTSTGKSTRTPRKPPSKK